MKKLSKFRAACLTLLVSMIASLPLYAQEAEGTVITGYQFPEWNECEDITLVGSDKYVKLDSSNPSEIEISNKSYLQLSVNLTNDASLYFYADSYILIYVDDELVFGNRAVPAHGNFIDLKSGSHKVKFYNNSSSYSSDIRSLGVISNKNIVTANLLEPGSLATEILYADGIDRLQDVHCLKVVGTLNDADFSTLSKLKESLYYLDLSEAIINEIPDNEFQDAKLLHTVVLPEGINRIGKSAFESCPLKKINFPSSLTSIGYCCFSRTNIEEAIINDNCLNWESSSTSGYHFNGCEFLKKVKLPEKLKSIFGSDFLHCYRLSDITFPVELEKIYSSAFSYINGLGEAEELVLPKGLTYLGGSAFDYVGYKSVVLPTSYLNAESQRIFYGSSIRTIRLESPTVVKCVDNCELFDISSVNIEVRHDHSSFTLIVPQFLVNYYKCADYWYDFGEIRGFDTSEISSWKLNNDLTLDAHNRFGNNPDMQINASGSFSVVGTDPLEINNLTVWSNFNTQKYGRVIGKIDNFTVNGKVLVGEYLMKNVWYYLSLPYNVKVSDITSSTASAQRAIRYYDGANRAENGTGNNWVNYSADDIIPAGTGFIFLSSDNAWWNFPAQEDASKQFIASNKMFVKELAENDSETASDKGWNLVGNPYQAWYNIHKMNFTAPITVRNTSKNNYEAYSIIDDDYALAPNQAFFVQCPEGTSEISFPVNGRQLTSEVTEQNGAPAKNPQMERVLVDLALNNGETADRTRVVLNQKASLDYETTCDASKFLSEANVAQVYTLDAEGTMYAINERPVMDGEIQLGVIIPADGVYSFALLRNMADNVYVRDNETGETVEITDGVYEFYAKAGTDNQRFSLVLKSGVATGITTVNAAAADTSIKYNVAGQKVNGAFKGIVIKNGKKVVLK